MKLVVTGAAGMLGRNVIGALLQQPDKLVINGQPQHLDQLIAFDRAEPDGFDDPRVIPMAGDITDPRVLETLLDASVGAVIHFAAVVSSQAEEDFELGMAVNLQATLALLEHIRRLGSAPLFLTTSSVAVFGGALPASVPDNHICRPQSSYGTQKAVVDLLIGDYSRRGYIDGRSLIMPTIVVRPGKPNRAASGFASGIIREPLAGIDTTCPVALSTPLWIMSPQRAVANILHGLSLPGQALGGNRVVNMPGLTVRVEDMLAQLRQIAGDAVADRVRLQPDTGIQKIVNSWPGNFSADRALSLGFSADENMAAIIRLYQETTRPRD